VEPFSVGTAASWAVRADSIADVHAYLYFDGTTLFVASVQGAPVSMAGRSVGADWEPVEVPMNIHVGGAKLAVRGPTSNRAGQEAPRRQADVAVPDEDEKTHFQPVPNTVRRGPKGAALSPGPAAGSAPPSAPESPPDSEATVVQRPDDLQKRLNATRPQPPAAEFPPESERTRFAPVQARAPAQPAPAAGQPAANAAMAVLPSPSSSSPEPATRRAPFGPAGTPMAPGASMAPGFVVQHGQAPPAAPAPGQQVQPGGGSLQKLKAQGLKAWREASFPQKAILVLLPPAFIAMFSLMGGQPEQTSGTAPSASAASAKSVAAQASGPPSAVSAKPRSPVAPSAVASATPSSTAPAAPRAKAQKAGSHAGKSQERLAVDAVMEGNYAEAMKKYQALAAAHPDQPVFKKAVQILEAKIAGE